MSTLRRANRRCAGSRRGGHGRGTHNPARGWDFLADPVLVGVTACEVKGDTGQGQLRVRGGLPPWPDPLRGPSLGLRMFGCWNALVLSGDATRTWRSRALVPSGDATCTWRSAADDSTDFDAAAWVRSIQWESVYQPPYGAVRMIRAGRANSVNSVKEALRRANSALLFMKIPSSPRARD